MSALVLVFPDGVVQGGAQCGHVDLHEIDARVLPLIVHALVDHTAGPGACGSVGNGGRRGRPAVDGRGDRIFVVLNPVDDFRTHGDDGRIMENEGDQAGRYC